MQTPKAIGVRDLRVGGRYLHINRNFVRQIDGIDGDTIVWHDQYGSGRCTKKVFLRQCESFAPDDASSPAEQEALRSLRRALKGEFTLRDEANALTAFAFRNGFLEDLHAGKASALLQQPGYSRISNDEMRRLMIEASSKLERLLRLKRYEPDKYDIFIRDYQKTYCRDWKRD